DSDHQPGRGLASSAAASRPAILSMHAGSILWGVYGMGGHREGAGTTRDATRTRMGNHIAQPVFWVTVAFGCLLFLIYPFIDLRRSHPSPGRLLIALAGMAVYVGIYLWLMLHGPFGDALSPSAVRSHVLLLVTLVAAVIFLTVTYGVTWAWFVLY